MTDGTAASTETGLKEIWSRAWLVFNELFSHTCVIAAVVISIETIQYLIHAFHGGHELIFFESSRLQYPSRWLFDAADTAMIAALLYRGVVSAYITYRGAKR